MLGLDTPYRLGRKRVSKGIGKGSMHIVETTMIYFLKENTHSLQVYRTHRYIIILKGGFFHTYCSGGRICRMNLIQYPHSVTSQTL